MYRYANTIKTYFLIGMKTNHYDTHRFCLQQQCHSLRCLSMTQGNSHDNNTIIGNECERQYMSMLSNEKHNIIIRRFRECSSLWTVFVLLISFFVCSSKGLCAAKATRTILIKKRQQGYKFHPLLMHKFILSLNLSFAFSPMFFHL